LVERVAKLRDFLFRGLLFESEAEQFRRAGIRVGADLSESEASLVQESLAPFGIVRRNQALEMARLYAILFAFENEVRSLIRDTLEEKAGGGWWDSDKVPGKVRQMAESRLEQAKKDSWLEGAKSDNLQYVDFGDLANIIIQNWDTFKEVIPGQSWLTQRMSELEKARNFVAHNRMLLPNEFDRIYMYISDWNKVVGI
jgi:hypothetical protein